MAAPLSESYTRTALVTGASQGIGRAIALRLARDGFDLSLNDVPAKLDALEALAKEIKELGRKIHLCPGDVSMEAEVEAMVKSTAEVLGGLDVMVANAGVGATAMGDTSITECSVETWDKVMAVNARGVFLCYKYAAKQMISQGKERGGRIIGASSLFGKRAHRNAVAYSASKFTVRGLTQSAADELGQHGITVNAFAPGYIDTEMTRKAGIPLLKEGEFLERVAKQSIVGFNGVPEDIASLVSYLASKESRFVTGQTMSINGGLFFD